MPFNVVLELSIFFKNFQNLDLFQQGWYSITATCSWEGEENVARFGMPSRVVQYSTPDFESHEAMTFWKISDSEHSYSTRPFKIRYIRQIVKLEEMVSFKLYSNKPDLSSLSGIVTFQLQFATIGKEPSPGVPPEILETVSTSSFRILDTALFSSHNYCALNFDTRHFVLAEVTIHTALIGAETDEVTALADSNAEVGEIIATEQEMQFARLLSSRSKLLEDLRSFLSMKVDISAAMADVMERERAISAEIEEISTTAQLQAANEIPFHEFSTENRKLSRSISSLWNIFLSLHKVMHAPITSHLRSQWLKDRWQVCSQWAVSTEATLDDSFVFGVAARNGLSSSNLAKMSQDERAKISMAKADLYRSNLVDSKARHVPFQDLAMFSQPDRQPLLLGEVYHSSPDREDSQKGPETAVSSSGDESPDLSPSTHVVVFVHGFQGHHLDLRVVRNNWLVLDPAIECLMSDCNEREGTLGSFQEMGHRLALEVQRFLGRAGGRGGLRRAVRRLSFVGHSVGNIIIRAALSDPALAPFRKFLHTFLSISGPHLGYLYSSNSLFNGGLWLLKTTQNLPVMHQLSLTDQPDLRDCYLFKLCQEPSFEYFRHVVLVASPQDRYVPYHSARVEMCPLALRDAEKGSAFSEMVLGCLSPLSQGCRTVVRCDVNFGDLQRSNSFNDLVGRAAHIELLESDTLLKLLLWHYKFCFV